MARRIREIRLAVGTAEPKHVRKVHGGPSVAFQLRDTDQVTLEVEALDAEGNPAAASVAWSSSDESVVSLAGDGSVVTATASPGAAGLGTATITVTATDTSDGDTHLGTFDIEVVASDAVTVNVIAGVPQPKP